MTRLQAIQERLKAATPDASITYVKYEHGGGRAFVDGESGARSLVLDCYELNDRRFEFMVRSDQAWLLARVEQMAERLRLEMRMCCDGGKCWECAERLAILKALDEEEAPETVQVMSDEDQRGSQASATKTSIPMMLSQSPMVSD